MSRRALFWWGFAAVALAALGGIWFLSEFTRVPTSNWEWQKPEARKNHFLALERFVARMGRELRPVGDARQLYSLPPGGVLILDQERRRHLPAERAAALLKWVEAGGYLIVAAETTGTDDPILRRLDLSWYQPPHEEKADDEEEEGTAATAKQPAKPERPKFISVTVPGSAPMSIERSDPGLVPGSLSPAWQAELEPGRAQVLHYAWGRGQITVFDCFCPFTNWSIADYDHADILWALLATYQPKGTVWLGARLKVPTLWEWLADAAWMPLASGAVLVLLWLWRIVPRFGGLRRLPEPERRGLADHLAAVGRGVWRAGGLSHWLHLVRQSLLARIARRHPHLLQLPAAERVAALARLSGMSSARVHLALEGQGAESPRAFTETVRAIQQLQQRL